MLLNKTKHFENSKLTEEVLCPQLNTALKYIVSSLRTCILLFYLLLVRKQTKEKFSCLSLVLKCLKKRKITHNLFL